MEQTIPSKIDEPKNGMKWFVDLLKDVKDFIIGIEIKTDAGKANILIILLAFLALIIGRINAIHLVASFAVSIFAISSTRMPYIESTSKHRSNVKHP